MKKILPILFFSFFLLACSCIHAQQYSIVKSQAFFRKSTAGSIPVDDQGNPTTKGLSRDYLIYIETKGTSLPQWQTAYIDGIPYTLRAVEVKQTPLNLGQLKGQKTTVSIKKGNGNRLWQMVLTPQQNSQAITTSTNASQSIMLKGTYRGKTFSHKITKAQELAKQFNP